MDRNYYYQKRAEEHQREISQELASRHLLSEAGSKPPKADRGMRLGLRLVPVAVAIIILLLANYFG